MPKLDYVHPKKVFDSGAKFKMVCVSLEGNKPFSFAWFKNGKLLLPAHSNDQFKIETENDESVLTIPSVSPSDSGNYSCKVSNQHGFDSKHTLLVVKG